MPFKRDEFDSIQDLFLDEDEVDDKYFNKGYNEAFAVGNRSRRSYNRGLTTGNHVIDMNADAAEENEFLAD